MLVVSSPDIPGKKIVKTLGLVKGNTIRARHIGKDILAVFKNIVGGEIQEYTKLMAESREAGHRSHGPRCRANRSQCHNKCFYNHVSDLTRSR